MVPSVASVVIRTPVVGEAVVHVRVSSANLGNDIRDSVTRGVRLSSGDVDRQGNQVGQRFANSVGDGVANGRARTDREAETTARSMSQRIERQVNRDRPRLTNLFGATGRGMTSKFKDEFNLGIGAARMGPAVISALALAGPSMLSAAGQIATALGGEIVSVLGALGPGIAGALGIAAAGVATLGLNLGLLKLAFSGNTESAKAFKAQLATFKTDLTATFAPGVLSGFSDMVTNLHDNLLPGINDDLAKTGVAMGDVARGFAATVTSAENLGRIRGILATNTTFLGNFGQGLNGLTSSFLILFNAAKPLVDFIGQGIKTFGEWAQATLSAKEASGELGTFMTGLVDSFKQLWGIVSNFGAGIANIFRAAAPVSGTIRDNLASIAQSFRDWTGDSGNQARMTAFFEKAHALSSAIFELIGKIAKAWGTAFTNSNIDPLLHVFQVIGDVIAPAIGKIFNQIQAAVGPNLSKILDDIGRVFTNIADSGSVGKVAGMVSDLVLAFADLIAKISDNPIGATLLGIGVAALLFGGMITSVISVITTLGGILAGLSAPVLIVAGAFALIYSQSQSFRDAIADVATVIWDKLQVVWTWLQSAAERLWPALQRLAETIGNLLAPVIKALAPVIGVLIEVIGGMIVDIIGGLTLFADFLNGLLSGNWQPFIDDTMAMFGPFIDWMAGIWDGIVAAWNLTLGPLLDLVINLFRQLWFAAVNIWTMIVDNAMGIWVGLVVAWQLWVEPIIGILAGIWDQLWSDAVTIWNVIVTTAQGVWIGLVFAWQTWIQPIINILVGVWNQLWSDASTVWNSIVLLATGIWTGLVNAWQLWVQPIINILSNIWDTLRNNAEAIWNTIVGIASATWNDIFGAVINAISPLIGKLSGIWDDISGGIEIAWSGLTSVVSGIWEGIKKAIISPISDAWTTLSGIFSDISAAVERVVGAVSTAFDSVNSKYESMLQTQANASAAGQAFAASQGIAGGAVVTGGTTFAGRNDGIFGLAKGGVVQPVPGGRQFIIGEGRRPERIEPLSANGLSTRDAAMIDHIVAAMSGMGGGSSDVNVRVQIGEQELRNVVTKVVQAHESTLAQRVKGSRVRMA